MSSQRSPLPAAGSDWISECSGRGERWDGVITGVTQRDKAAVICPGSGCLACMARLCQRAGPVDRSVSMVRTLTRGGFVAGRDGSVSLPAPSSVCVGEPAAEESTS